MENDTLEIRRMTEFHLEQRVKRDEARQRRILGDLPLSESDLLSIRQQAERNIESGLVRSLAVNVALQAATASRGRPKARKPHSKTPLELRVQIAVFAAMREGKPHKPADIARALDVDPALLSRKKGKGKRAYLEAVALGTSARRSVAAPDGGQDESDDC